MSYGRLDRIKAYSGGSPKPLITVSSNQLDSPPNKPDVDWVIVDPLHVLLRAESEPVAVINHQPIMQPQRIYTITATITDTAGSSTSSSVNVKVHPPEDGN